MTLLLFLLKKSSIIWSASNEIMEGIKNLSTKELIEELNSKFDNRRGKILKVDHIGYFNLYFSITKKFRFCIYN